MQQDSIKKSLESLLGKEGIKLDYPAVRPLLDHADPNVRVKLASHEDVEPEVLVVLAADPDLAVRCAVASNPRTPKKADLILAEDSDSQVRLALADRVGAALPSLEQGTRDSLAAATKQVLSLLARDQHARVRKVIAEAVKDLPFVGHDLIFELAKDQEDEVAVPVLQFSPLLSDEDLLSIIHNTPMTARLVAISRRAQVSETISAAVADVGDDQAIAALLGNHSAQIREDTLDAILSMAPERTSWHEPLVRRPGLSADILSKIASFVAEQYLKILTERADLNPKAAAFLKKLVVDRLCNELEVGASRDSKVDAAFDPQELEHAARHLDLLRDFGGVNSDAIPNAIKSTQYAVAILLLAELSGLTVAQASAILRGSYPKAVLSIAWKAGLTAKEAVQVQQVLGRIPPSQIVMPDTSGGYRLTDDELAWYLSTFSQTSTIEGSDS